jgi:uncharacterized surface protein with fasciclin (FAS1) repeats
VNIRRTVSLALVGAALTATVAAPMTSAATPAPSGSVLALLEADGTAFDGNWYDFDILEAAARTVLAAKPGSTVAALGVADANLTVFAPNDRAFQVLVASLTGKWYGTEAGVVNGLVTALGASAVDTIESVLLYHVVPGKTTWAGFKALNGKSVATVLGPTIGFRYYPWLNVGVLKDQDPNAANPWIVNSKRDIMVGTNSVVHGIALVLRPADLPPVAR